MEGPPIAVVRPALELAWAVARTGEQQVPPVPAPGPIRPLLRFARLPERALQTVRRVLDDDETFRERVAGAGDETVVGRAAWLWLTRPEGWDAEVARASVEALDEAAREEEQRGEHTARRRLAGTEAARRRLESDLAGARATIERLSTEVQVLRQERRSVEEAAGRDRAEAMAAREAAEVAGAAARSAVAQRDAAESTAEEWKARAVAAESERDRRGDELERTGEELAAAARLRQVDRRRHASTGAAVARAVAEAAVAAERLGSALADAAAALRPPDDASDPADGSRAGRRGRRDGPGGVGSGGVGSGGVGSGGVGSVGDHGDVGHDGGGAGHPPGGRQARSRAPAPGVSVDSSATAPGSPRGPRPGAEGGARRPLRLPFAVLDDSSEAAAWLVRSPGAVVLVDGYNVTLAIWPDTDLAEQRHRLVHAMAELSMRTGAQVEVVFDGAEDHAMPAPRGSARRAVRVEFSPPQVDADEVIIDRVAQLPAARPVVVVTDDRRVRDIVAGSGANLLSTGQLGGLIRRGPSGPAVGRGRSHPPDRMAP